MSLQRLRIGEDTDGLYRTIDAKEWSECPYLGIRSPFSQSHPSRGAWIGMTLITAVTPLHPHITQGRTVVESPTWRGVRHGNCPGPSEWLTIASPSKGVGHGVEGFENETRNDATRVGRENRRDTTAYSGLRDRRAPVERNESRCCDTYLRRAQGA